MAISYERGSTLGPQDLYVFIRNNANEYVDVEEVSYEIFYVDDCGTTPMLTMQENAVIRFGVGQYYAPVNVPVDAPIGTYLIRWDIKKDADTNRFAVENKFNIKKLKRC